MSDDRSRRISQLEEQLREEQEVSKVAQEAWHDLILEIFKINERREMRLNEMVKLITHAVIGLALISAYTIVTVTGNDGNGILTLMIGYLGGAGAERVMQRKSSSD